MLLSLFIHQKQLVTFRLPADIDIFSHLDITIGAEHECAAVSPCAQTIRSEPVYAEIGSRAVARNQ